MPPGGNGYYYFSVYLRVNGDEAGTFDVEINGEFFRVWQHRSLAFEKAQQILTTGCKGHFPMIEVSHF